MLRVPTLIALGAAVFSAVPLTSAFQVTHHPPIIIEDGPIIIVPPVRQRPVHDSIVRLIAMSAQARIDNQVATTTLEMTLHNPGPRPQEAQLLLPVPGEVTIRSMAYDGVGPEPSAKLLPRDEGRSTETSWLGE